MAGSSWARYYTPYYSEHPKGWVWTMPYQPYKIANFPKGHAWATFYKPFNYSDPMAYAPKPVMGHGLQLRPGSRPVAPPKLSPAQCDEWARRRGGWGVAFGPVC